MSTIENRPNRLNSLPVGDKISGDQQLADRFCNASAFILDLDDTLVRYPEDPVKEAIKISIAEHALVVPDPEEMDEIANTVYTNRLIGASNQDRLEGIVPKQNKKALWARFSELFADFSRSESTFEFDEQAVDFIDYILRNSLPVGVISNNTQIAGMSILDSLYRQTGIRLHGRSRFVGQTGYQKPNPEAFACYASHVHKGLDPTDAAYIGNGMVDLRFAGNIGAVGAIVDPNSLLEVLPISDDERAIVNGGLVAPDFRTLLKFYSRRRHEDQPAPFFITKKPKLDITAIESIDSSKISLPASPENTAIILNEGVERIVANVPAIKERFKKLFEVKKQIFQS